MERLKRELRFWDSVAITVGIVIGVGIFRVPSEVASHLSSSGLILSAWLFGGLISLLGVLCYAELSSQFPETGGTYVFFREAYGKFIGFLYGWAELSINRAASIAAVAYIFAAYLRSLIPYGAEGEKWIAILAILILTVVNMIGVRFGVGVQSVLTLFKVTAILAMAGSIFWFVSSDKGIALAGAVLGINSADVGRIAPAMIPILWTYGGWHESTFMSGEFRDTKRELPISLIVSSLIVTGIYVLVNASYLLVIPPAVMVTSKAVASDALLKLFGAGGSVMITLAVLISASGALNSTILTGGRIPFSVALDFPQLSWIGQVDSKFKTPLRSLALNGIWASFLVLFGNFEQLLFFNAFEIWLFFILAGVSVFVLRRKSNAPLNFRMAGYPVVPILFTLVSAWLCWTTVSHAPKESLMGALLIMAGVPIYMIVHRRNVNS